MSNLVLKLGAIAGSDIDHVCQVMVAHARNLSLIVNVNFNGVELYAKSDGDAEVLADNYQKALLKSNKYEKSAWSH